MPNLGEWAAVSLRFVFILLLGGPLGEELGWRGFALPRLLAAQSPASASLRMPAPWLVSCALAWLLVATIAWRGGLRQPRPATKPGGSMIPERGV